MNIKVGDKVRIKTEKELLAEGWTINSEHHRIINEEGWQIWRDYCGRQYKVTKVNDNHFAVDYCVDDEPLRFPKNMAEVLPQTLDEFICNLPLEERAKWFVFTYLTQPCLTQDFKRVFCSTCTYQRYDTYDEALQATIEALKQSREI